MNGKYEKLRERPISVSVSWHVTIALTFQVENSITRLRRHRIEMKVDANKQAVAVVNLSPHSNRIFWPCFFQIAIDKAHREKSWAGIWNWLVIGNGSHWTLCPRWLWVGNVWRTRCSAATAVFTYPLGHDSNCCSNGQQFSPRFRLAFSIHYWILISQQDEDRRAWLNTVSVPSRTPLRDDYLKK